MTELQTYTPSVFECDRVREAISLGMEQARALEMGSPARYADGVWHAIEGAMETLKRLPDREAGWLYTLRGAWPQVAYDESERIEHYEMMLERCKIGEAPIELKIGRTPPNSRAISRMELIFDLQTGWHRFLRGRKNPRDWRVLCQLAMRMPVGVIARDNHLSKRSVYDIREKQCEQVAVGLQGFYPDAFTEIDVAA